MRLNKILSLPLLFLIASGCITKALVPEKKPVTKVTVKTDEPSKKPAPAPVKPIKIKEPVIPRRSEAKGPRRGPVADKDKYIVLNFDQADIQIVLQTISEILGMNYILGPKISGKITIQTYKKIPKEDIFNVLHSILEINGFTTVKTGHYYKIIPLGTAKQYPIKTVIGKDEEAIPEVDIPVTQIIPLEYIAANEVAAIIKSLISKNGNLITHKNSGMLILTDIQSNLRRLMKIINLLDTPAQQELQGERVYVYYIENGEADKIAKILNQIYKQKKRSVRDQRAILTKTKSKKSVKGKKSADKGFDVSDFEGELKIVADTDINALIIKTTQSNYESIVKVIKQIDIIPRQVLIEVLIADVTLSDSTSFGLEWVSNRSQKLGGESFAETFGFSSAETGIKVSSTVGGGVLGTGFTYLLESSNRIRAILNVQASKGNVNVLSSPYILAADNKEAVIDVITQVPIETITYTGTDNLPSTTYQYKDAGIRLKVTPKINKKGLVNMSVSQEVSSAGDRQTDGSVAFNKRLAQTTVVVQDGQTLVIGGLIEENVSHNRTGIPFLMDIPVLGYLFGTTSDSINRTELIILITPHVIHSHEDAQLLTEKYKQKMEGFQELKERVKGEEEKPIEEL